MHPTPYTTTPTPYTPQAYTLRPTPCTLRPTPYVLHPTPYMRNLNGVKEAGEEGAGGLGRGGCANHQQRPAPRTPTPLQNNRRESSLLTTLIIVMIRWTGLAPWEFEWEVVPITSSDLRHVLNSVSRNLLTSSDPRRSDHQQRPVPRAPTPRQQKPIGEDVSSSVLHTTPPRDKATGTKRKQVADTRHEMKERERQEPALRIVDKGWASVWLRLSHSERVLY